MYKKKSAPAEKNAEGAVKAALSILACKENTEKELFDKLIGRGFERRDAAEAVRYAVLKNYLSEKRYFLRFVEYCGKNRHFGRRRILQEAYKKKFSAKTLSEFSEAAFSELDFGELCYETLLSCAGAREKAAAQLLRRGYSADNLRFAFSKYKYEHGVPYGQPDGEDGEDGADAELDDGLNDGLDDGI